MLIDIFDKFKANMPWLHGGTIMLTKHGSHAYGTNTPTSDLDIKGIAVPPREYFLGFHKRFEQAESRSPVDLVIYDIRKFFALAADCNPNICEILWTADEDHLLVTTAGLHLLHAKALFLSKKARYTFSGYAHAQLKRINTHYRWLTNPPKSPPFRADFGLPEQRPIPKEQMEAAEAAIKKRMDSWQPNLDGLDAALRQQIMSDLEDTIVEVARGADREVVAARGLGFDSNFLELLDKERQYKARKTEWSQYQEWLKSRNPDRAALEKKYGYDTKHGMHLVRLMRMCEEILEGKGVIVKRPDAKELLEIRNGALPYEKLLEWANKQEEKIKALYETSKLPRSADIHKLDELCQRLVESYL